MGADMGTCPPGGPWTKRRKDGYGTDRPRDGCLMYAGCKWNWCRASMNTRQRSRCMMCSCLLVLDLSLATTAVITVADHPSSVPAAAPCCGLHDIGQELFNRDGEVPGGGPP